MDLRSLCLTICCVAADEHFYETAASPFLMVSEGGCLATPQGVVVLQKHRKSPRVDDGLVLKFDEEIL